MSIDVFPATVLNSTLWNGQTYEEGTFTVTATGFTTTVTGEVRYIRAGSQVTAFLPSLAGISNATTFTITGWPPILVHTHATSLNMLVRVLDNGVGLTGLLQFANTGVIVLSSSSAGAGWTASGGKQFISTCITYDLASALAAPGWTGQSYEEGTFTVTGTGFSGTAPSGTAQYVRVGKQVTVVVPPLTGTSNATTFTLTGWPAALLPNTVDDIRFPMNLQDNVGTGLGVLGLLIVTSAGVFNLYTTPAGGTWTASGTKRLFRNAMTYLVI